MDGKDVANDSVGEKPEENNLVEKQANQKEPAHDKIREPSNADSVERVRKQFFIVLAVAGVLIAALVISIIVVAVNKKSASLPVTPETDTSSTSDESSDKAGYILSDEELNRAYSEEASDVAAAVLAISENGEGFDGILQMYQEKINAAEDVRLKAMLEADYYLMRFSQTPTEEFKNEVLNALMRIDGVLKTAASAYNVITVATFYNEQEIVNYYTNLAMERNSAESNGSETGDEEELETAP